jgi:hypothetical protein
LSATGVSPDVFYVKNYTIDGGTSVSQVDLSLSASQIKTALQNIQSSGIGVVGVIKSGQKIKLETNLTTTKNFSLEIVGLNENITYEIQEGDETDNNWTILFQDSRSVSETYTNPSSIRPITCNSHGISAVGTVCALFRGDKFITTSAVATIPDANTLTFPLDDIPGATFQATHLGISGNSYSVVSRNVHTRITTAFFQPGITSGITDSTTIPVLQTDDTPERQLAAIVGGSTWIRLDNSQLDHIMQNLYARTITEAKVADVFPTI